MNERTNERMNEWKHRYIIDDKKTPVIVENLKFENNAKKKKSATKCKKRQSKAKIDKILSSKKDRN